MKNEQIASKIKDLRSRKGLSQEALAEKSGISNRTVQRIENGESQPTGDTIIRLADALAVKPDDLMDWVLPEDRQSLRSLNLSALTFIPLPILGILIPFIIWSSRKDRVRDANELGTAVVNFQINWLLVLIGFPVILYAGGSINLISYPTFSLLFQWVIGMYLINVILILYNTVRINSQKNVVYPFAIRFLK